MNANGAISLRHIGGQGLGVGIRRCPWVTCTASPTFIGAENHEAHRRQHMDEMLSGWSGASKCLWPKCSSNATFKTRSSLRTHLSNIHVTPLVCTHPQCSYKKPFGKQYELDRHISTAHGKTHSHKCPIDTCEASVTGFPRKDKLVKHLREQHEKVRCPYNHCSAVVVATQEEEHIRTFHGDFECAIGGCDCGIASRFSHRSLKQHFKVAHGMDHYTARELVTKVLRSTDRVARQYPTQWWKSPRDCESCSSLQCSVDRVPSI